MNMQVFLVEEPYKARIIEIPPRPLKKDEVLVKVACAGICGTDLSIYTGETDFVRQGLVQYPARIGHEWSGIVSETGTDVLNFKKGDRVIGDNGVSCGQCDACLRGDYDSCPDVKSVGTINCWDGCFAEYIIMPARHLFRLPDLLSFEEAALIEPATISYIALKKNDLAGKTVVIIGTGPIGMAALPIARHLGAKNVVMIGRTSSKLDIALKMGATHVIRSTIENVDDRISKITCGKGAEIILEASGDLSAIRQSMDIVSRSGFIYLLAFYEKAFSGVEIDKFSIKEASLAGVIGKFGIAGELMHMICDAKIDLLPMVTSHIRFDEIQQVLENARQMKDRIKILVHFK